MKIQSKLIRKKSSHIPVQIPSPRKKYPLIKAHDNDSDSPIKNNTRLGTLTKGWLQQHPPYVTRTISKKLEKIIPIQRKIDALEKEKTPSKVSPRKKTGSKCPNQTIISKFKLTPIRDDSLNLSEHPLEPHPPE